MRPHSVLLQEAVLKANTPRVSRGPKAPFGLFACWLCFYCFFFKVIQNWTSYHNTKFSAACGAHVDRVQRLFDGAAFGRTFVTGQIVLPAVCKHPVHTHMLYARLLF